MGVCEESGKMSLSDAERTKQKRIVQSLEEQIAEIEQELVELEGEKPGLDVIQIDGLVVLKIIQHCKRSLPDLVTGQLLGLGTQNVLEVTNCFPFPRSSGDDTNNDSGASYQIDMMKYLREVNADSNTVGWYQSTYLGSCLNESMIDFQYNYQTTIKKCVVIVYDPLQTTQGTLSLKAYRLTESFMELYKAQSFSQKSLDQARLSFNDIFEEVKIEVKNSTLSNAWLWDIEGSAAINSIGMNQLDLSGSAFLEKNLEVIIDYIDDLSAEQNKYQLYQRQVGRQQMQLQKRKSENAARRLAGEPELPEEELSKTGEAPSRLESMLITNQINNYCHQINRFAGRNLTKLYLFNALSKASNQA